MGRCFALLALQPHRVKSFNLSTDLSSWSKVRDIVGLYLNPADEALLMCVHENSQVQALECTQRCCPWEWVALKE